MKSTWLTACVVAAVAILCLAQAKPDEPAEVPPPAADSLQGTEAGQVRDDNSLKMKLVWCPQGLVTMEDVEIVEDAPAKQWRRKIVPVKAVLSRGYWLGKYEVTQAEWKQVMGTEPWKGEKYAKEGDNCAVTFVSWHDATAFCEKLTEEEHKAGRLSDDWEFALPTEAEWEHGCRAGTETKFSFGDDASALGEYAWFRNNAFDVERQYAHRVGQKKPNRWGLYDMHGNVWEWCLDAYQHKLPGGPDPVVKKIDAKGRVNRGGGWADFPTSCQSAKRSTNSPDIRGVDLGFRVALRLGSQAEPGADVRSTIDK